MVHVYNMYMGRLGKEISPGSIVRSCSPTNLCHSVCLSVYNFLRE